MKNLVFGTTYSEQVGEMIVTNYQTGEVCIIDFKAEGSGGKNRHYMEGFVYNSVEEAI